MNMYDNKYKLSEIIKKNKTNIYVIIGMFIFTLIICSNFLKVHFAQDTYSVYYSGFDGYIKVFLISSRILSATFLAIANLLNISFEATIIISSVMSIICLALAWFILYKYSINLLKKENNTMYNLLIIGISFSIIFNFCTFEMSVFIESGVMALSLLLAVLAACMFFSGKYFKSFIILIVSSFGYQPSIGLFILIALVFIAYQHKDDLKSIFKKSIWIFLYWGIIMLINLLISKSFGAYFNEPGRQTAMLTFADIINTIFKYGKYILIDNIEIGFKYWYLTIIIILTILFVVLFKKNKTYFNIFEYVVLLVVSILIPIVPLIATPVYAQYMVPRMCITFGSILGIILLYLIMIMKPSNIKIVEKIIYILTLVLFAMNSIYFIIGSTENIATGYLDKNVVESIIHKIDNYERESGIKINNIGILFDSECTTYYNNQPHLGSANVRAMITDWAIIPALEYYGGEKYNRITNIPDEIKNKFNATSWNYYSDEQLVFEEDTLYLCLF